MCGKCRAPGHDVEALLAGRFSFLGRELDFAQGIDWQPSACERLWNYHLHYFDWALALALRGGAAAPAFLERHILDWIEKNPPGTGAGWEPYPLSLRIVNLAFLLSLPGTVGGTCADRLKDSLAVQARCLVGGIEKALQGNHLVKNGKALVIAGLAFEGKEAEAWLCLGMRILEREMATQVRPDGGHADRSAMYHSQVLLDYLETIAMLRAAGRSFPDSWPIRVATMLVFLEAACHPDGSPALFGDTSLAGIPPPPSLIEFGKFLGVEASHPLDFILHEFPDSAYAMARNRSDGHYLTLDCGTRGDALEAAHYHCQIFSYEMSFAGQARGCRHRSFQLRTRTDADLLQKYGGTQHGILGGTRAG